MDGFCWVDEKEFGPVQDQEVKVPVDVRFSVEPTATGELLEADKAGGTNTGQVTPEGTPPGAIQFEVAPVNPKPFNVPVLAKPLASIRVISVGFAPPSTP